MSVDKSEDKFDKMLGQALRRHTEPVPADFTAGMLRQIEQAEQQKILARVVLQERLALAGCIAPGIIAVVAAVVFPDIAGSLTGQAGVFIDKTTKIIELVSHEWQFYTVMVGVFGFVVYSFVDLLAGDS